MKKNSFFNKYFAFENILGNKTSKVTRISDNIVDLNPTPLYIKPVIANVEDTNDNVKKLLITINRNIDIDNYNDENAKKLNFFTTQGARITNIPIMIYDQPCIHNIYEHIHIGTQEILKNVYNYSSSFKIQIGQSNIHSYKNSAFLSPHTHFSYDSSLKNSDCLYLSAAYYVDDGDPDENKTHSGCVTFISGDRPYHVKPISGSLLIWESTLVHLVNPFYSKSNKERTVITVNFIVILNN
jgi:hypothetical protein